MVLEEDVNGFKNQRGGKKSGGGKKHKKASCLRVSFACVLTLVLASE